MMLDNVLLTRDGDFAIITMNRPERRNALSRDHIRDLRAAFEEVASGDAAGIVLAGAGPVFSAGHDLAEVAEAGIDEVRDLLRSCADLVQLIESIPQPVVARVHGLATAAGCQLVAACDLAVAVPSAGFAAPGGKGGWFCHTPMVAIARNVGRKRAAELALTGDAITAEQALDWGLINRVAPRQGGARPAGPRHPRQPAVQGPRQGHALPAAVDARGRRVRPRGRGDGHGVADSRGTGGHGRVRGQAPSRLDGLTRSHPGPG
jgi:enoyl-CoA hydratase/carnithine racemase